MVQLLNPKQVEYIRDGQLLNGEKVTIRLLYCEDREALIRFHSKLSLETKFFRYQYSKGELTEKDLKEFCELDYHDNLALVAEQSQNGRNEIIGVGRFYRLPTNKNTAEVAFVVRDDEQRKGVGTLLIKHLAVLAWERDIKFFIGEVLRENGRMLSIFQKSDQEMQFVEKDDHTCTVSVSVAEIINRTQ